MYKLIVSVLLSFCCQQSTGTTSPDGRFKITVEATEETDLQTRFITRLTDNRSRKTIEIANCIRRDWPAPRYYWDKDCSYLIFEQCSGNLKEGRVKIMNLETKKVDFEVIGLLSGESGQEFDRQNGILFYFAPPADGKPNAYDLCTFDLAKKKSERRLVIETYQIYELPVITRTAGKQEITVTYTGLDDKQKVKRIAY